MVQRESDQHGPRLDDEMKHELSDLELGDEPSQAQERRDPEPWADDDPQARPVADPPAE